MKQRRSKYRPSKLFARKKADEVRESASEPEAAPRDFDLPANRAEPAESFEPVAVAEAADASGRVNVPASLDDSVAAIDSTPAVREDAAPGLEPGEPEPREPGAVESGPTEPDFMEPAPIETDSIKPGFMEPDPIEPDFTEPGSVEPGLPEPDSISPDPVEPSFIKPDPVGSEEGASFTVKMPELYERRDRQAKDGKRNLFPDAKPQIIGTDGKVMDDLREHHDYEKVILADRDGQPDWAQGALARLTDAGDYWVVVRGTSGFLQGAVQEPFQVEKRRRRIWPWLVALLALVAVIAGLVLAGLTPWYDPNAGEGIAGLDGEDLQAYLDAKVEEGSMNITVVTPVVFRGNTTDPDAQGKIAFNNLAANHVDQKLRITLDDEEGDAALVYESPGAIAPGQNVQYINLNRELAPGVYDATATVTGYDRQTHEQKGSLAAQIQIVVRDAAEAGE